MLSLRHCTVSQLPVCISRALDVMTVIVHDGVGPNPMVDTAWLPMDSPGRLRVEVKASSGAAFWKQMLAF